MIHKLRFLNNNKTLIAILLLFIFYYVKKFFDSNHKTNKHLNTLGATISDFEAEQKAENLFILLKEWNDNESAIYHILRGITKPNYAKIFNKFGLKYRVAGLGVDGDKFTGGETNLTQWILSDLTETERKKLKEISPNVFS
jgi:hypothetical protein